MDLLPNELLYHILSYTDGIPAHVCHLWHALSSDKRIHLNSISTVELKGWALQQGCMSWHYYTGSRSETEVMEMILEQFLILKMTRQVEVYVSTLSFSTHHQKQRMINRGIVELITKINKYLQTESCWKVYLSYSSAFYGYSSLLAEEDLYITCQGKEIIRQEILSAPKWNGHTETVEHFNTLGCQWIFVNGPRKGKYCLQRKVSGYNYCKVCMKKITVKKMIAQKN